MIFDESGDLKNKDMKDDDDMVELFKLQSSEGNETEAKVNLDSHVDNLVHMRR